jgi:hypothetical protein
MAQALVVLYQIGDSVMTVNPGAIRGARWLMLAQSAHTTAIGPSDTGARWRRAPRDHAGVGSQGARAETGSSRAGWLAEPRLPIG